MKINKKLTIAFIFIILIFIVFILSGKPKNNSENNTLNNPKQVDYRSIVPGESNADQVKQKLGDSVKITNEDKYTVWEYKGSNINFNDEIYMDDNKVKLIKKIVSYGENITSATFVSNLGNEDFILYGPHSDSGFYLYVYKERGIAYLGNKENKTVLEYWYFDPVEKPEDFINNYAKDYTLTRKEGSRTTREPGPQ